MENDCNIDFIRSCVPTKIEQIEAAEPGKAGKFLVTAKVLSIYYVCKF